VWAGTFVIIKTALETISPFYFLGIRFSFASIIFFLFAYRHLCKSKRCFPEGTPRSDIESPIRFTDELKAGLILALLLFSGFASQTVGMVYTTASNSALITGVNVLVVPFAQYLILKKKVMFENWIGVSAAMTGLILLTKPFEAGINIGDAITLICAFSWGFYIIYIDVYTRKYNIYVLVLTQFVFVAVVSMVLALIFETRSPEYLSAQNLMYIGYNAIFATLLATFLCNRYQKETTPVRAALILTFEQPGAVILAMIVLKEYFSGLQIAGGILMILGIVFSETYPLVGRNLFRPANSVTRNGVSPQEVLRTSERSEF
jgi:drug/metabolite transporter (DMT)-like permease